MTRRELLQQFENLHRENDQLKVLALQTGAIARENNQLRSALGWQRQVPWKLKLANVVLRDPANWWRSVEIDLGTRDGVVENLPRADGRRSGRARFIRRFHTLAGGAAWRSELQGFRTCR